MPEADMTFESNYDVEILKELPSGGDLKRFYYPGSTSAGGRDGLLIKVTPAEQEADPWIGIFAFGLISPKGVSGVFSHPDPETICVVSRGAGYLVRAVAPRRAFGVHQAIHIGNRADRRLSMAPVARQMLTIRASHPLILTWMDLA